MQTVHLLFTKPIRNKDGSFFTEVEFDNVATLEGLGGLTVIFEDQSRYLYPWHTLARVRTKTVDSNYNV